MSDPIYHELILDLNRNPLHKGKPAEFSVKGKEMNTSCGDKIEFFLKLNGNKVDEVFWDGQGCAISCASASLLSDSIKGKTIEEVKTITPAHALKLLNLENVNPARKRCAEIPVKAALKCFENYGS